MLSFEYNQKYGKLKVSNQKGKQFEMNVENSGEKYAACAFINDVGDSIELIN